VRAPPGPETARAAGEEPRNGRVNAPPRSDPPAGREQSPGSPFGPLLRGHARRCVVILLTAVAALTVLHVGNLLTGRSVDVVDFEREANLPTWFSSMQFFAVGLCAGLLAGGSRGRPRLAWHATAAVFVFFSVDELATIHERALRAASSSEVDVWYWPVLFLPVFAAALAALWSVSGEVRRELGSRLPVLAGVALLGAALAFDALGTVIAHDELRVHVTLRRMAEELLEIFGALVLVATFVALLEHRLRRLGQLAPERRDPRLEEAGRR
jgi:hypothetical protein